jgi:hypothetical protein
MFPPLHELLIDNLTRIVFARLDMDRFFHDRIRPTAKRFASTILHTQSVVLSNEKRILSVFSKPTWHGTVEDWLGIVYSWSYVCCGFVCV